MEAAPEAPSPGRAQPAQTLQAALQQLLENAAAGQGPQGADFEAIGAIAEAAAAVAEEMEEEQEGSSDEEGVAAPAEVAAGGGGVPALFQQLEQQALARADEMAVQQPPQPPPAAAAGPEHAMSQHTQRLWRLSPPAAAGSLLWSLLGSGLVQWEVAHRDPACELPQLLCSLPGCQPVHSIDSTALHQVDARSFFALLLQALLRRKFPLHTGAPCSRWLSWQPPPACLPPHTAQHCRWCSSWQRAASSRCPKRLPRRWMCRQRWCQACSSCRWPLPLPATSLTR